MVSLLSTKFHEILFSSFRGVALTNCVTDTTKTICLPTKVGGDIIPVTVASSTTLPVKLNTWPVVLYFHFCTACSWHNWHFFDPPPSSYRKWKWTLNRRIYTKWTNSWWPSFYFESNSQWWSQQWSCLNNTCSWSKFQIQVLHWWWHWQVYFWEWKWKYKKENPWTHTIIIKIPSRAGWTTGNIHNSFHRTRQYILQISSRRETKKWSGVWTFLLKGYAVKLWETFKKT